MAGDANTTRQGQVIQGGAAWVADQAIHGTRNPNSGTNNYDAIHEEISYFRFAPGAVTETLISSVPVFVYGWMGITGTGTLSLRDAATTGGGSNPVFGTPSLAAGGLVSMPGGIRFENGLTAQLGTGTDVCVLLYRPIN